MIPNPFKPTAGKMPPILIGRQAVIDDFSEGLVNGAGAPGRLMLVTGQRGYGKTVMLTELGRIAQSQGWVVVSETASEGMCARLISALAPDGIKLKGLSLGPSVTIAGVASGSLGSASFSSPDEGALTLREAIEAKLKKLPKGKGVLFTIDEAQAASMQDMVALATTLQHVIRDEDMRDLPDSEKHGVAFVFAALPSLVDGLLQDKVLTFLRRSMRHDLGAVPVPDVKAAYIESVVKAGMGIESEVALFAAKESNGYPYMIQLIGYYMWRSAEARGSKMIEQKDVEQGIADAKIVFMDSVCAPLFDGLASPQRVFLEAMVEDGGRPTRVSDIAKRAGKSLSWANKYRASLIKGRVIEPADFGFVRMSMPQLSEYLISHRMSIEP